MYAADAQTPAVSGRCIASAVPSQVRSEGITERMGDILLECSGSNPGAVLTGNFSVYLPVNVTNRVDSAGRTTDAVFSVDYGSGFVPLGIPGQVSRQIVAFNGINVTIPPSGNLTLRVSNLRANVNQFGASAPQRIAGQIIFSSNASILVNQSELTVAFAQPGLFAQLSSRGVIACVGSPAPSAANLASLFEAGTAFASTRVTEGFAASFQTRGPGEDSGTRFLVKYTGFPAGAKLFVPDFVAGSNAAAPTSGGDLGVPQQVGQYVAGSRTLLLARVSYADGNGAGGIALPVPSGGGTLQSVSEVPLTNGAGYAVYEVVDANPAVQENAQFPTFVAMREGTAAAPAQQTITFAPASAVRIASVEAAVPRFAAATPQTDCTVLRDCSANYYPHLSMLPNPVELRAIAGGAMTSQPGYIAVDNSGGGTMPWTAVVRYSDGADWLTLDTASGRNNGSVRLWAKALALAAGTYRATVTIEAGLAGSVAVAVTLVVAPAPVVPVTPPAPSVPEIPPVTISRVVNAATFQPTPMVAGSLGTLMGANLAGTDVSVTFDDLAAEVLYRSASQINVQVPAGLGAKTSAQVVATVDGRRSAAVTVPLAPAWPSVFAGGVLNQDYTPNGADHAARAGSVLQIFGTGIPAGAAVSVTIGGREGLAPLYAGPAPTVVGVQQVNVMVPEGVEGSVKLTICVQTAEQKYCSVDYPIVVR